uniref:Uncharacterized protein n=1 Tax=Triticum urartu TaxID=4572 RepID=A0A8R7QJI2_TRIUA
MAPLPRLLQAAIAVASWARADLTRNSTPMSALWKWSGHAVEGGLLRRLEAPANPSHHWLPERLPPLPLASSTSWPCAATRPPSKFFCRLRLTLWSWIPTEERYLAAWQMCLVSIVRHRSPTPRSLHRRRDPVEAMPQLA